MIYQSLKLKESFFCWWMPNIKLTKIIADTKLIHLCLPQVVHECQTKYPENRLILELIARVGMRIGEVLKPRFCDIQYRRLIIKDPKNGKTMEIVFISQKVVEPTAKVRQEKW